MDMKSITSKNKKIVDLEQNLKTLIKRRLKEKGWSYIDLAKAMRVKVLTVRRWMTSRPMKLDSFFEVLLLLDINLFSYLEENFSIPNKSTEYSLDQENYLSQNPLSALVFLKLVVGYKIDEIKIKYRISEKTLLRILRELEKVKLMQLWPGEKIKLKVRGPFRHRPEGPNSKIYFPLWISILNNHFSQKYKRSSEPFDHIGTSVFRPFELYLSPQSAENFARDLMTLFSKYRQLNAIEYGRRSQVVPISGIFAMDEFDSWEKVFLERHRQMIGGEI